MSSHCLIHNVQDFNCPITLCQILQLMAVLNIIFLSIVKSVDEGSDQICVNVLRGCRESLKVYTGICLWFSWRSQILALCTVVYC